ncbi:MAG: hypothetical protein ABDH91_08880 [Bacteroidia bacterium]
MGDYSLGFSLDIVRRKKTALALIDSHADKRALYEIEGDKRVIRIFIKYIAKPRLIKKGLSISWSPFLFDSEELGFILYELAECGRTISCNTTSLSPSDLKNIARTLGYTDETSLEKPEYEETYAEKPPEQEEFGQSAELAEEAVEEEDLEELEEIEEGEKVSASKLFADCRKPLFVVLVGGHTADSPAELRGVNPSMPAIICVLSPSDLLRIVTKLFQGSGCSLPRNPKLALTVRLAKPKHGKKIQMVVLYKNRPLLKVPRDRLGKIAKMI